MAELLIELFESGLMDKLDGQDNRLLSIEKAAKAMGKAMAAKPIKLVGAILAGLDPDIPTDDPSIIQAKQALVAEWKTMGSVYTSPPIGLYRTTLLVGCQHAAVGSANNAAIVWLTAADTLPFMRLGKEEGTIRQLLQGFAERTEEAALVQPEMPSGANGPSEIKVDAPLAAKPLAGRKVNREELLHRIAASAGPQYRNKQVPGANPRWSGSDANWSWDFADRMNALLADELDAVATELVTLRATVGQEVHASQTAFAKKATQILTEQRTWVQNALQASEARQKAEQARLDALWWSEALYSVSLRRSYRQLPAHLGAVVMAADLLQIMPMPAPASVGYLLAETVNRLPDASFDKKRTLLALLNGLRESRGFLPAEWVGTFNAPPDEGRFSLRDLVVLALGKQEWDPDKALRRAGLSAEAALNLPDLAHAVFRQDQAVELAGSAK